MAGRCLREAESAGSHRLRGRALVLKASVATRRGDLGRAFELLVEAERETEHSDAPDLRGGLAIARSRLSFLTGAYREALARAEEAVAVADKHELHELRMVARRAHNLVLANVQPGLMSESVKGLLDLTIELGDRREEAVARNDVAYDLFVRGQTDAAMREVEQGIRIARELGPEGRFALAYLVGTRGEIRLASGDIGGAMKDLDEALSLADSATDPAGAVPARHGAPGRG